MASLLPGESEAGASYFHGSENFTATIQHNSLSKGT
jgi:hypothetical protein